MASRLRRGPMARRVHGAVVVGAVVVEEAVRSALKAQPQSTSQAIALKAPVISVCSTAPVPAMDLLPFRQPLRRRLRDRNRWITHRRPKSRVRPDPPWCGLPQR